MPERRKMKSPSPKMTSTPKMKRKEIDREDSATSDIQKRLGYSENPAPKKEFSTPGVELTEYNDGTTRPMFKKRLKAVSANSGEMAQLECVVSGSPLPKVLWLKNNRPLKASDGCKVVVDEGSNILVFPNARDEDVGTYTARAMNVNGSIMCSTEFSLTDGRGQPAQPMLDSPMDMDFTTPAYFFQMSSCEVSEGRLARFDCRVVAYPRPEIVWMRDGKVVEAADRFKLLNFNNEIYSLLIQDVRLTDTGRYTCWARNKFGEAMTEAYLNVISLTEEKDEGDIAPKFLTRFYDQQTTEGTATDFKCLIAGRPEPDITWLVNDGELQDQAGIRTRHKDGVVSLEIKKPKLDHSGQYTCQLKNTLGDAACSAKLIVVEDKLRGKMLPKFLRKFDHVNAKEGEEVKFTCVIVGEPRPEVQWMFEHKPISDTNRHFSMKQEGDSYTLIVKGVRYDDAGKITCKAFNEEGEVYCSANLHVREPKYVRDTPEKTGVSGRDEMDSRFGYVPTFTKRLHDVEAKEGSKAMFECRVMGIPEPEISWMKDGRVIVPGGRFHMTSEGGTCQMTIDNITPQDAGVYTCIISNAQGKSSSTASLKLEEPVKKKERFTPEKTLDERLSRKDRYTPDKYLLEDTGVKRPYPEIDKYDYDSRRGLELPEMKAPPRLPTHRPIITDLGEETIRLAWRPVETYQAKRTPPVSYRLEAKELPGKDWMPLSSRLRDTSHYLSELPYDRDYMIRVRAENDFGVSEPTEPLWLPRARAFPGVPVTRPEITDYEDTSVRLSWTRVDIPSFQMDDSPLLYMIEVEEPPSRDWRTVASDLYDTEHLVEGLRPGQDYRFRVRAKTPRGVVSEPSPAVSLYTALARSHAPVDRLEVLQYEPDTSSVQLSWQRVDIPPYNRDDEPLMYMLEYQEPPLPDWKPLVTGIPTTRYRVMHLDSDRDYKFRVRAFTPYGVSPPSPALPVTLRQSPISRPLPEAVIISEVEPDSLRLTWRRPMHDLSQPISYQVEMLEPPFTDWRPIASRITDTTYKVTGLRPTRDYQFRVIPHAETGYMEPTPSAALTTLPVRPRLPMTEPKLRELTPESVQLSWRPAEFPAYQRMRTPIYYKVEMAEQPTNNWVPVARRLPDTSYNVTGLKPEIDYKFRIVAETDTGFSEPSLPATLNRQPVPRFPTTEPLIKDISQNTVTLAWTPAEVPRGDYSVSYQVEVQTPPGISSWRTLYNNHPNPSVRLADLRPDLDYLVRVRAQSGTYLSEPTLPVYIPRRAAPPRLPQEEPYAVHIGSDHIKLQWRSADLPSHILDYAPVTYRLEAQELPNTNWVTIARGISHTDFKVTGLKPKQDYSFRIRAENEYGVSDATRPMVMKKRSVAPHLPNQQPLMYDYGPGSVHLSWRPASLPSYATSTSPMSYSIFVQEHPFTSWRPLVRGIPHTSYHVTGLNPDKEYMFRVQAENEYGTSRPSDSVRLLKYAVTKLEPKQRDTGIAAPDLWRPISMPEISDYEDDRTSLKIRWRPTPAPHFDTTKLPGRYTVERWEPVKHEWSPVARGIPDTTYQVRDLPRFPDHVFRVRMDSELPALSEPSLPVSLSRFSSTPRVPIYRPQLYEVDSDTVKLSWQPVHLPDTGARRIVRYTVEQREIPETRWFSALSDITDTHCKIRGLRPKLDYEFRVKTIIDGAPSEPSLPVSLFRRAVIPKVRFDAPEVYDMDDSSLSLRWNTVDVPAFKNDEEPLLFIIERQTLPEYEWQPIATNVSDRSYRVQGLEPYRDYNFRVRGIHPSGYTEPSPYVPVYRRPIRPSVPVAYPEVWEEEPSTARLRWQRAYIPRYYSNTEPKYRVEMQEADATNSEWRPVATHVHNRDVTVPEVSPRKDYNFRIRAEMENGDLGEPTPPIHYHRTRVPMVKYNLEEFKPVQYEAIFLNRPYLDHLCKYVPPRMPIEKPDMIIMSPDNIELTWHQARVPDAIKNTCNLTYTIEVRCPPSFEWREVASGLKVCFHNVSELHPKVDYVFRVRAWNEYGCSEPSLPVSLYRPYSVKHEMDDEEFDREWELRFGAQEENDMQKVPPKLPMDTPRIVTQSADSIWFSWHPARIPAYATQTQITYVVEVKEPPSTQWKRDIAGLLDCQYVREGLDPSKEYHIRVKAETEHGPSEPTLPIILRGKGSRPTSRRSSVERDDREELKLNTTYLDTLTSGVPPRMASTRPLSSNVGPDRLTLSWTACRVPAYVKTSGITYTIEKREPPGHVWTVLAKDVTTTRHEITGLDPERDYMFRVRARNEFGTSDATLPLTLYRDRDDYVPQRRRSRSNSRDSVSQMLAARVGRRSSSFDFGSMRPSDTEPERSSVDRMPVQPEYLATSYDTQYGVWGRKGRISLQIRGHPIPTVHWYKGEEKIQYGDMYNAFVSPKGDIVLEIQSVTPETAGQYKCYAENASGAAVKVVFFELAEPPTILETMKDVVVGQDEIACLKCRVDGFPNPTVKWLKDWRPLSDSAHVRISNSTPETHMLEILTPLDTDSGLYACVVENAAGKVTVSGRLTVEFETVPGFEDVNIRSTPIEEKYHVLEEIGRGRYGVVRRVVEIETGRQFAANFMHMRNKAQKNFFMSEFEVLRKLARTDGVLKIHDAFETDRTLILVTEIITDHELLDKVVSEGDWTEARAAALVSRLLGVLRELEALRVLHLDIKPSNIRVNGDRVKLLGFGVSRVLLEEEEVTHNYGSVGYASPEQVNNDVLTARTDVWSIGVLIYILLTGNGPFKGASELEIVQKMGRCEWGFDDKEFEGFSPEARDLITKLLVKDPSKRLSVDECIDHPWLQTKSAARLPTDKLRLFNNAEQLKRETEKVFTSVQLQSFAKILHGTRALYQPAVDIESGEITFPDCDGYGDYLDEDVWYEWQLQYLDDPDSQIFAIRDSSFTVRESRHAGAPKYAAPRTDKRNDVDDIDSGTGVMFRDKLQTTSFWPGRDVTLSCVLAWNQDGEPPVITWYRDETLITDDYRADSNFNTDTGEVSLKVISPKDYDSAVYKCVARTRQGRVSSEARLMLGDYPSKPGRPLVTSVSGTEAFLTWSPPASVGNTYLLGYRVDYRRESAGERRWTLGPYVTEEYALISGLVPDSTYTFRVSCTNKYGPSPFSSASLEVRTLAADAPKVSPAQELIPFMQFVSFPRQQLILPAKSRRPSLAPEASIELKEQDPAETYELLDTIASGSYGEYKLCTNKESKKQYVTKIVSYNKENQSEIMHEFDILRHLSHANVISVFDAYVSGSSFYTMYENLTGMNVVQYLCLMKSYKEDLVATLVRQVIDALQYLQFFGIAHLNLQPSSIVMATRRRPFVKLRDFTLARKLEGEKIERAPVAGYPDFTAPEVLKGEPVSLTTDLWTLGAVTFTLLSGVSPYGGKELEDTLSRILFDRYDTRDLHENVSKESVKFVTALMRRIPKNRPSVSKCLDSQWLQLSESMTSSRASRSFKSDRLRAFSDRYLAQRVDPHYRADTVDIEKLPKPTAGPLVKPILSDKIVNRYEQMMKKRNMQASLDSFSRETMAAEIALTIESDTPFMDKMAEILDTLPDRKVADTATAKRTVVEVDEGGKDEGIKQKSDKQVETLPSNIVDKSDTILSSKTEEIITKTQDKVDGTAIDASQKMENEFAETKDLEKEKSEVKTDANVKDETDGKSKVAVSQDSMAELKQKEEISKIKKEEVMTQTVIDDARSEIMKTNQTRTSQKVTQKQDEKSLGSDKSKTDQSKNTVEEQSTKTKETSESKPDSKMDATSSLQSSDQQCDAKEGKLEAEAGQNTTEAQQTSNTNMTPTGTVQSSEKTPEITEQNRLKTDEKANEEHSSVTLKEGIDKSELSSETKIDSISPIEKTNVEITSENKISSSLSDSVSTADTDNLQVNANEKISDGVVAKNKVSDGVDTRNENTTANTSDICERSSAELVDASRSGLTTAVDQTKEKSITESPNNHALQEEISPQEANETEKELQTVHNNKPNEHNNAEKNEECIKDNNVDADIKIKQNTNETVGNVKNDKALDDFEIETLNKQQEQKSYDEMQNEAKDTLDTDKCEQSDTQVDLVKDGNISSSNEVDSKRQSADVLKETKVDSLLEREVAEENEKIESPQETGTALQSQLSNKHLEEKSSIVSEQEESIESVKFTENVSKVSDLTKEEDNSEAQDSSTETASGKAEDNQIYNTNKNAIVAEQINAELNTNAVQEVSTDSERVDDSVISTAKEEISKTTTANTSVQEASTEKASSKAVDDQMHEANNDDIIAERNNAELNTNSVQEVSTDYETVDGCVFSMAKEEISNTVTAHAAVEEKQSENVSTMEASREENKSSEEDIFERSVEKQEIVEVSSSVKGKDIELHENKTESIKSDLIASEMNELNAKQTVDETSSDTNVVISKEDVKAKNIKAEISQETGDNEERADISGNATDISSTESGSLIKSQDSALLDTDKTVSEENKSTIKMENTGETILEKSVLESQLESISETSVARRLSKEITVTQVESVDSAHASILQQQDELAKTKNTDLEKRVTESITESSLDVSETVVNSEEQVSVISTEGYNKSVAKEITAQSELVVEKQEDSCANVGQSLDEEPFSIEVISSDKEAQSLQEEFVEKLAESHVIVNEQTKTQVGGEAELSETTVSSTDIAFAETSEALKVTSESSHSTSVSVEQRKETLTSGEATVVENASTAERVIEEISTISSSATNTETILTSETSVEQQKESLIAGGTITADIENLAFEEGITVSNTEQIATEEAETLLETAKVTESRETVREFASNDDELEEMKKEILEDTKILSADCGKYLMGSHEETPNEEEIASQVKYMDDALMFC
ncbi:uncharacterized protein LOC128240501 isoform X5 [Mya arenaria]|uniref:uncharacterized protein LOC128240501 isoform X5 n=1 Tax=Mya arenaria TaxID=6604 RepID=UPI0022E2E382|nr:uncharacterized protein LOC128240501 isoform X5 [Mya arenaria]